MLNSTTLEVAIGMALIYLLLSLCCTAINEGVAGILGSRAKNLENGIRSLFTEGSMPARDENGDVVVGENGRSKPGLTLAASIYGHGLVQSLYKTGEGEGVAKWFRGGKVLPSYIPSRTFASALFDLLFPGDGSATVPVLGSAAPPSNLQSMLNNLQKLPPSEGKEAITTLVKQAAGDIVKTRQSFESWYDDGMDRVAGWYKRKTQLVLFFLGLSIAVALNVDSIAVGRALWTTPAPRSYAVTAAQEYATGKKGAAPSLADPMDLAPLQSLALPIGWNGTKYIWLAADTSGRAHLRASAKGLPFAIVGWLLTAIAMTLGAPFWFDTLNQIMVVRSTLKPREKSEVEGSKDAKKK
jgi:hypothetical protein